MKRTKPARTGASKTLDALAKRYWESLLRHWPLFATFVGDPRWQDRLEDPGLSGRGELVADLREIGRRVKALKAAGLAPNERISRDLLDWQIARTLERYRHKFYQWGGFPGLGVDHLSGLQSWIPTMVELAQPMATEKDARALIKRIEAMPACFRGLIANLKQGSREGRLAARVPVEKTMRQLGEMAQTPADRSSFAAALAKLPVKLRVRWRDRVLLAVEESAKAAYREYFAFLESYRDRARPDEKPGICFVAGGEQAYEHLLRYHTSLELSPKQIHRIGLEELEAIHEETREIAGRLGHRDGVLSFLEKIRKDPKNFFSTREEILDCAEGLVKRTYERLPDFFGRLPATSLAVRAIEAHKEQNDVAARYFSPPQDLSRPGIYYINTFDPASYPRFSMASLTAHEGVPGHHLQIAIAAENRALPTFQRFAKSEVFAHEAFAEGWALYSERLADEMGLYSDDLSRVGMLSDQAFRACRLVVDTGLHAFGWSRRKAIEFVRENTPMSQAAIESEIDRYMVWPGQALAYKLGQRSLIDLRRRLSEKLGARFDLKSFHDAVLENGPLPLSLLEDVVERKLTSVSK